MEGLVFSGNAVVHFDGVSAYDEHMVISGGKLVMNLEGEDGLRIVIRDHRPVGFGTMMSVMSDPQTAHFSHHFHSPARVRVYKEQAGDVRIDLFDTYDPHPAFDLNISPRMKAREDEQIVFSAKGISRGVEAFLVELIEQHSPEHLVVEEDLVPVYVR